MSRKNKNRPHVFNPPTRYPQNAQGVLNMVAQAQNRYNKIVEESSNNTLNLVVSAYSIVLHEFYDIPKQQLNEILSRVFEQFELCADEIVTIDQMMDLCNEYGLQVKRTGKQMGAFGNLMLMKTAAFELLDKGITEIEDIARQGNMTSRLASAFRWQWNKKKFGKDYEGDEIMSSKREMAYQLFEKGVTQGERVAKAIDSTKGTVYTYLKEWKKMVLTELNPEETASYLADEKGLHVIWAEHKARVEANKKTYEAPKKERVDKVEVMEEVPKMEKKQENTGAITGEANNKTEKARPAVRKGLRKCITIEGEFAQYKRGLSNFVKVEVEGQVITLNKTEMAILAEELEQIVADADMWKGEC